MRIKKVRKFFLLDNKKKILYIEAFVYLGWARILLLLPFKVIAPSFGVYMEETSTDPREQKETLMIIHDALHVMKNHTFWESKCLVMAIAGMKMLHKRRIESTLYLGIARDKVERQIAHAWLRSGPYYITGKEEMSRFTVVGKFSRTC